MRAQGKDNHRLARARPPAQLAFTLVELLVVVSIIALMMGILVPATGKAMLYARTAVCQSNLRDVGNSLEMYQTDNSGWLPALNQSSSTASSDSWSARLFENNPAGWGSLICPEDPWATVLRNNLALGRFDVGANSSYGLNDFIVSSSGSFLANRNRQFPSRPDDTILLADMGPDLVAKTLAPDGLLHIPVRNFGRLAIDDLYEPGLPPDQDNEPWLTGRHNGKINMLSMMGNVKQIAIRPVLARPISTYYAECAARSCTICTDLDMDHYSFAESSAFWWTGRMPKP
jgi:prepilin-type N-terminal cleavage/methylation domain-containing protein